MLQTKSGLLSSVLPQVAFGALGLRCCGGAPCSAMRGGAQH